MHAQTLAIDPRLCIIKLLLFKIGTYLLIIDSANFLPASFAWELTLIAKLIINFNLKIVIFYTVYRTG